MVYTTALISSVVLLASICLYGLWHFVPAILIPSLKFTRNFCLLRRPAGYSLSQRVVAIRREVLEATAIIALACLGLVYLLFGHVSINYARSDVFAGYLFVFVVSLVYLSNEIWLKVREAKRCQRGLDGELATAECLKDIESMGAHIFHDLPVGGIKIDHVVVSAQGVFAIETKTWRKSKQQSSFVVYDGETLKFPLETTDKPVNEALFHAQALNKFILKTTGESISVQPVVSLPGWAVLPMPQHPVHAECCSINPKNFRYLMNEKILTNQQVIKISDQLLNASNEEFKMNESLKSFESFLGKFHLRSYKF